MQALVSAFLRAVWSQLHYRMLLLTLLPFGLSVLLWGGILWWGLNPLIDRVQATLSDYDAFGVLSVWLGWLGMGSIKAVVVPLIAMWLLLPLMMMTALICIGILAMPVIVRHVGSRHFPELERRGSGALLGSLWVAVWSFLSFIVLWLVTLPLSLIPVLGLLIHPLLWGWLTYRVLAYDALAGYADRDELRAILRQHRWPLLAIGAATGVLGTAPTLLWLGGAMSVVLFPVLAAISIWLYVLVFVFTGLWFEHYCLARLAAYRHSATTFSTTDLTKWSIR